MLFSRLMLGVCALSAAMVMAFASPAIAVDVSPPVTTPSPAAGTFTASQSVTLACSDAVGCTGTYYCLGSGCTPATSLSGPIAITSNTDLRFYSTDAAGNNEAVKTVSYRFVGTISGRVIDSGSGSGIQNALIIAYGTAGDYPHYAYTDSSGNYQIAGLGSGNFKLEFSKYDYIEQWYSGKADQSGATSVTLVAPGSVTGIDASLVKGGSITGTVTAKETGAAVQGVSVVAYNAAGSVVSSGSTDSTGAYRIPGLAAGDYKLNFDGNYTGYLDQWYDNKADLSAATPITVTNAGTTSGIDAALTKGGAITGTVTDSVSGAPISGVSVTAYDATSGFWINSGSTNSTGVYTIVGLAGSHKLRFSGAGYVEQWYKGKPDQSSATTVAVTAPNTASGINMVMVKGGTITGIVTDSATGTGIQYVYVDAYDAVTGSWAESGYTNSSGVYSITGLASGGYKLRFSSNSADGYVEQWYAAKARIDTADIVKVTAPDSVTGINVVMEKGAVISGTVTDGNSGAALQGVYVEAFDAVTGAHASSGSTDSSGAYSIGKLVTGNYTLMFNYNGYLAQWFDAKDTQGAATAIAVTAPNATAVATVSLTKGGSISGTISDRVTGAGIAKVRLYAIDLSNGYWSTSGSVVTDSNGNYTITGLASGSYRLNIEPSSETGYLGKWYGSQDLYLCAGTVSVTAPDTTSGVDAALDKGGSISGLVTDAETGSGISGVAISLWDSGNMISQSGRTTDSSGAYTISGLLSGAYTLTFSAPGYISMTNPGTVTVSIPDVITGVNAALVRGGGISGRVTDSITGQGVADVSISAVGNSSGSGLSDSNGDFAITGLSSGSYRLYFDARDNGSTSYGTGWYSDSKQPAAIADVSVIAPAITGGIDISIPRKGAISGRVTDRVSNKPLRWFHVTAYDSITGASAGWGYSNSDSTYTINGLSDGVYRVQFSGGTDSSGGGYLGMWYGGESDSQTAREVVVKAPEKTTGIDAALVRGGTISGSISVTACPGPQWVSVKAYDAASGILAAQSSVTTRYGNRFTLGVLPAGSYKLAIDPGEAGFVRQWYPNKTGFAGAEPVTVTAGSATEGVEVQIATGGGSISGKVTATTGYHWFFPVKLYDWYSGELVAEDFTGFDGSYQLTGLPDATYKLLFSGNNLDHWYRAAGATAQASPLVISGGIALKGIDMTEPYLPSGDLDGSGAPADILDAIKALRIAVGLEVATPEMLSRGDVAPVKDGISMPDGIIDIADALVILHKAVGLSW
jgi:hypothetical protein